MAGLKQAMDYNQYQSLGMECHNEDEETMCIKREPCDANSDATIFTKYENIDTNRQGDFPSNFASGEERHEETILFDDNKLLGRDKLAPGIYDGSGNFIDSDSCNYVNDAYDPEYIPPNLNRSKNKKKVLKSVTTRTNTSRKRKNGKDSKPTQLRNKTNKISELSLPCQNKTYNSNLLNCIDMDRSQNHLEPRPLINEYFTVETRTIYTCKLCSYESSDCEVMIRHIELQHGTPSAKSPLSKHNAKCEICQKSLDPAFADSDGHNTEQRQCNVCDHCKSEATLSCEAAKQSCTETSSITYESRFSNESDQGDFVADKEQNLTMQVHNQNLENNLCIECTKVFMSTEILANHVADCHTELSCEHCGNIVNGNNAMKKHTLLQHKSTKGMLLHTRKAKYKCPKCNKRFTNKQARHSHIYIHHFRIYHSKCSCGKKLANEKSLKNHKKLHEQPKHECVLCEKTYHIRSNLRRHIREIHPEDPHKTICCPVCEYSTKKKYNLVLHTRRHHTAKPIPCTKCDRKFAMKRDLYMHQVTYHNPLTCKLCGKIFKGKFSLVKHKQHVHEGIPRPKLKKYECHLCDKSFPYEKARLSHIKHIHHNILDQECPTCGKRLANENSLKNHLKLHEEASFQCTQCSKAYHLYVRLARHVKEAHSEKKREALHCVDCDFVTFTKRNLERHKQRHHQLERRVIPCPNCDRMFSLKADLRMHIDTHHNELACELCGKVLKGMVSLQRHVTHVHEGQPRNRKKNKRHYCDQCGKAFSDKHDFISHMNSHLGIFPFSCSDCEKNFPSERTLKCHKRQVHSGIEHRCGECSQSFRTRSGLKHHKQSLHATNDVKPHVCETCGKHFVAKGSLTRHQLIHTGARPWKCQLCSDAFNDYSILRRHVKGVHKSDDKTLVRKNDTIKMWN